MPDLLYQSHSLEKTNEGISGSLTFWGNSPVSPFEVGDTFSPIPDGTPLTVEKVSIKDNVLGGYNGKVLRQWEITVEGSNNSSSDGQTYVKYNFTILDNIKSGTMEVTNTGASPVFSLNVGDTFSVPGIGNVTCTEITGNDEYSNDGTRRWTVIYAWTDGNGESDTRYNFSIEKNGSGNTITTGSKTVTNTGNAPSNVTLPDTLNLPGIGNLPCVKVSGNDDYDDDGTQKWTVTYESSDANDEPQTQNVKYNINVEKNSDGVVVYSGTKEIITAEQPQSLPASVGDILSFPLIGEVTCVRVTSHNNDDSTWSVIIECSSDGNSSGGEGGSGSIPLPETEEIINYDLNGYTVRTVKGELLVLQRSNNYAQKKTITEYSNSPSPLRLKYTTNDQTVISETISKETITNNGSSATYYKHVIEVES